MQTAPTSQSPTLANLAFADRIRAIRQHRRISQARLAERLGLVQSQVSQVERGWLPPAEVRAGIAAALEVGEAELFAGAPINDEAPEPSPAQPPSGAATAHAGRGLAGESTKALTPLEALAARGEG